MSAKLLFRLVLFIALVGLSASIGYFTAQAAVPTPTLLRVETTDNPARPWIVGLTPNNVEVEVWINNKPVGWSKIVNSPSGTASFGWSPSYDFKPGLYEVKVRGKFGDNYSNFSQSLSINIPWPTPQPVLVEPEVFDDYVLIRGLIANNTKVKIYIDDKLWADFAVPNHPSGTTNFWFKARNLLNGEHVVYARAYDAIGKLSKPSNNFTFSTEFQPVASGEAREKNELPSADQSKKDRQKDNSQADASRQEENSSQDIKTNQAEPAEESRDDNKTEDEDLIKLFGNSTTSVSETEVNQLDQDQTAAKEERNRLIGFGLLVIIVILLLTWYKMEQKRLLAKEEDKQESKGDSDKDNSQTEADNPNQSDQGEDRPDSDTTKNNQEKPNS